MKYRTPLEAQKKISTSVQNLYGDDNWKAKNVSVICRIS